MTEEVGRRLIDGVWVTNVEAQGGSGGGGITRVTSDDETVTIVNPTGPTVDLSAGGGSQPGAVRVLKHDFDFSQAAALKSGVTVYTPMAGDVLVDAWIDCPVAWNTDGPNDPKADIGSIVAGAWDISGFFNNLYGKYNLTNASTQEGTDVAVGISSPGASGLALAAAQTMAVATGSAAVVSQVRLITTNPLSLVVSSDGTPAGDESDVTSGAATLYIVVSSPGDAS